MVLLILEDCPALVLENLSACINSLSLTKDITYQLLRTLVLQILWIAADQLHQLFRKLRLANQLPVFQIGQVCESRAMRL